MRHPPPPTVVLPPAELVRRAVLCRTRGQVETAATLIALAKTSLPPDLANLCSSATAALADLVDAVNVQLQTP